MPTIVQQVKSEAKTEIAKKVIEKGMDLPESHRGKRRLPGVDIFRASIDNHGKSGLNNLISYLPPAARG